MKGEMNIDFEEVYDEEDDIYYVSFKTGEPSSVVEVNDNLLVEVGIFTHMPTGFRILELSKGKVTNLEFRLMLKAAKKTLENTAKQSTPPKKREELFERALEDVLT